MSDVDSKKKKSKKEVEETVAMDTDAAESTSEIEPSIAPIASPLAVRTQHRERHYWTNETVRPDEENGLGAIAWMSYAHPHHHIATSHFADRLEPPLYLAPPLLPQTEQEACKEVLEACQEGYVQYIQNEIDNTTHHHIRRTA